jgi:hypothetical protein
MPTKPTGTPAMRDLRKERENAKTERKTSPKSPAVPTGVPTKPPGKQSPGVPNTPSGDIQALIQTAQTQTQNGISTTAADVSGYKVGDYTTASSSLPPTTDSVAQQTLLKIAQQKNTAAIVAANQDLQTDLNKVASDGGRLLQAAAAAASNLEAVSTGLEKYKQSVQKTQLEAAKLANDGIELDGTLRLAEHLRAVQTAKVLKIQNQAKQLEMQAQRFLTETVRTVDTSHVEL